MSVVGACLLGALFLIVLGGLAEILHRLERKIKA